MTTLPTFSAWTVCGIGELDRFSGAGVSHVLSIVDPGLPELTAFHAYGDHQRTILEFDDIIDPEAGKVMPERRHMAEILRFAQGETGAGAAPERLLVHCHLGISRSTAAMASLIARSDPNLPEDEIFTHLRATRPQAWPNCVLIGFADELLGRNGRLIAALRRHYAIQIRQRPDIAEAIIRIGRRREVEMAA
ncbi:tyrosine phosphatase family protein [Labrys neptuniae]